MIYDGKKKNKRDRCHDDHPADIPAFVGAEMVLTAFFMEAGVSFFPLKG